MTQESIHEAVRSRYGAIARSLDESAVQAASCCGDAPVSSAACCGEGQECGTNSQLYDLTLLEGLPVDVTRLSLGCEGTQFTRSNASCCAS